MRRTGLVVLAILAALALILLAAATADAKGKPSAKTYTITFQVDSDVPSSWSRRAPLVWENGTKLDITRGTCSGAMCVKVHTDAQGTACSAGNGCAGDLTSATFPDLHTTTCHVWLPNAVAANYSRDTQWSMFAHEFGHCLGLSHSDDPYSIMWPQAQIYQPTMYPNAGDIANVNALWR